jgi:hypothetical protein
MKVVTNYQAGLVDVCEKPFEERPKPPPAKVWMANAHPHVAPRQATRSGYYLKRKRLT